MQLGIPVYQGVDLLDAMGPYEMFKWVKPEQRLEAVILSEDGGPVTSGNGVRFEAHSSFGATPTLGVLWVPLDPGMHDSLANVEAELSKGPINTRLK